MIEWALTNRPAWFSSFDCAILLNQAYPGGIEAAYDDAVELIRQAKQRFPDENQDSKLAPAERADRYTFVVTSLSSRVRRKILAFNCDLTDQPIKTILPTLYDVIIDLNLDYYAGRDKAREWVRENVPLAIKAILKGTTDIEQKVRDRTQFSQQYVFARMEARVLLELVKMDTANACALAGKSKL